MNKKGLIFLVLLAVSARGAALESDSLALFRLPGVPEGTYEKVVHGAPLNLDDVATLSRAGVSHAEIIAYLYSYGSHFRLSAQQIVDLRQQGVTTDILDYIVSPPARMVRFAF